MGSRAALVTGCSSGIGRAVVPALAAQGLTVWATARRPESIDDLAGPRVRTLALDVTDDASMRDAVERVEAEHGHVDVLVNNAGYALQGPVEETSMDDVRAQFETNVFGLVRLTQLVLPGMRAAGHGVVVNVGSMGGRFTFPGGAFYHASKHAVEAISDGLRLEVAPFGVHVVLVQPGPVTSSFVDAAVDSVAVQDGAYATFSQDLVERYREAYDGSSSNLEISPDQVAAVIAKAATAEHPRARYAVGLAAKALITSRRVLPDVAWDRVVRSMWPTPKAPGG